MKCEDRRGVGGTSGRRLVEETGGGVRGGRDRMPEERGRRVRARTWSLPLPSSARSSHRSIVHVLCCN